jgi:hypothetical protein
LAEFGAAYANVAMAIAAANEIIAIARFMEFSFT